VSHPVPLIRVDSMTLVAGKAWDGEVHYTVLFKDGWHYSIRQPFRRGTAPFHDPEVGDVWAWDGNEAEPTITPDLYWTRDLLDGRLVVRLFVDRGRLMLRAESTVAPHPPGYLAA